MDDLISRQGVIDAIKGLEFCHYMEFGEDTRDVRLIRAEKAQDALKKLPSAQQWIPCSEMLPMDNGVYLVTDDSGRIAFVEKSWFMWCDDGSPFWEYANVTAWMPMPKPYKGVNNE